MHPGSEFQSIDKIGQIKQYIQKGISHYREIKEMVGVEALKNILLYINQLEQPKEKMKEDIKIVKIQGAIPTSFGDFEKPFYDELDTPNIEFPIYIEKEKKRGRGIEKYLEVIGKCKVGINTNIIYIIGEIQELPSTSIFAIKLIKDETDSPAFQIYANEDSNIRFYI